MTPSRPSRAVIAAVLLACGLQLSAWLKVIGGYRETYALPAWVFFGAVVAEFVLSVALCTRIARVASRVIVAAALIAAAVTILYDGDCG